MDEHWAGCPAWSEEKEQAEKDIWALRVLTCPLKACRRAERCTRSMRVGRSCPGLAAHPHTREHARARTAVLRFHLQQALQKAEAGETFPEKSEASKAASARREALAFQRARVKVREMKGR
jgi:hypothetical protein